MDSPFEGFAIIGTVKAINGSKLDVFAHSLRKNVPIFHNAKFPLKPEVGDEVVILNIEGNYICIGSLQK